jgi:hypothetical protein
MKKESSDIFDLAFNQWQGNKAIDNDLFDLKISDMIKMDIVIINNIKRLISKVLQRSKNMGNLFDIITIENNLNRELDEIISDILPESIFCYNINILELPLYKIFFESFENLYSSLENNLYNFINTEQNEMQYKILWIDFAKEVSDIYINIANIFWEQKIIKSNPATLKRSKKTAAKN